MTQPMLNATWSPPLNKSKENRGMGVYKDVNITLTGQVPDDWNDKDYEVLLAEIRLIAAKYSLEVEE